MRIFYASGETPNESFKSQIWRNNLLLPLRDLGHEVIEFKYDLRLTLIHSDPTQPGNKAFIKKNRPIVTKELLRQLKEANSKKPIDLFFSYFYDSCILPVALEEIKSLGIKTVNWYCNGSYQLHLVSEISPFYDWCLVPEKFRIADYKAMGANPIYSQEAANPNIYKPFDLPYEYDVTFVGQAYGERPYYIKYLLDHGLDLKVWGQGWNKFNTDLPKNNSKYYVRKSLRIARQFATPEGWQKLFNKVKDKLKSSTFEKEANVVIPSSIIGGVLSDIDMIMMYSRSKINLGFSSVGNTHKEAERIVQVRLRDFEVPMSGGFYMVEYMEELEEFFDIGKEIVCYKNTKDLAEKIKYYLVNESEREEIRRAGHARCLRDHSWQKRFEVAFEKMGLAG